MNSAYRNLNATMTCDTAVEFARFQNLNEEQLAQRDRKRERVKWVD